MYDYGSGGSICSKHDHLTIQFNMSLSTAIRVAGGIADAVSFINCICNEIPAVASKLRGTSASITQPHPGAWWVTYTDSDVVISAYYHPTQKHTATVQGKLNPPRSVAEAGEIAYAQCTASPFGGNKAFYNTL